MKKEGRLLWKRGELQWRVIWKVWSHLVMCLICLLLYFDHSQLPHFISLLISAGSISQELRIQANTTVCITLSVLLKQMPPLKWKVQPIKGFSVSLLFLLRYHLILDAWSSNSFYFYFEKQCNLWLRPKD